MAAKGPRPGFTLSTPWYHGWNIIAVTLLIQGITLGLMTYSFTLWIAPFKEEFGAAQGTILLAASIANVGMGVFAPFAGRIIDKHSIRLITIIGIAIFATGFFLISLTTAIWQVILIYATVLPVGAILGGPLAAQVMTARWFEKNRGTALGISSIGSSMGGVVLPPIAAALIVSVGWRFSHMTLAVAALVVILPILWLVVRDRYDSDIEPGRGGTDGEGNVPPPHNFPDWKMRQVLKSRTLWVLVSFMGPMMFVMTSIQFNIAPISEEAGIAPQRAAFIVSTAALTMVFGKLLFGFLSDRIEHRFIIWMAAGSMLICLTLLQIVSSFWLYIVAIALLGLASGGMMPVLGVIIASRYGAANFGRVNGMLAPFITGFAFGPVLIGYLREGLDSWEPIYILLMIFLIPTVIGAFFLGPTAPEVPKDEPEAMAE